MYMSSPLWMTSLNSWDFSWDDASEIWWSLVCWGAFGEFAACDPGALVMWRIDHGCLPLWNLGELKYKIKKKDRGLVVAAALSARCHGCGKKWLEPTKPIPSIALLFVIDCSYGKIYAPTRTCELVSSSITTIHAEAVWAVIKLLQ